MEDAVLQRVKSIITEKAKNATQFSREIGMNQVTLNNYLLGKRKVSLELVMSILTTYGDVSSEWLLRGTGTMSNGIEDVEKPIMNNDQIMSLVESINTMSAQVKSLREENLMLKSQAQNRKKA